MMSYGKLQPHLSRPPPVDYLASCFQEWRQYVGTKDSKRMVMKAGGHDMGGKAVHRNFIRLDDS